MRGVAAIVSVLCIRCGDDLRPALARLLPQADYLKWADPLCDGPTPADLDGEAWYALRARFITQRYDEILAVVLHDLIDQDQRLALANDYDEVVLWFEHDLFDQAILLRLLAWFAEHPHPNLRLIDHDFPLSWEPDGVLAELWQGRQPVSDEMLAIGDRGWAAWRAADPGALVALAESDPSCLPHMSAALWRHFQEFPDAEDGLTLTERLTLLAVADGAATREQIFAAVQAGERAPWLGDSMFWPVLRDLTGAKLPLLREWQGRWELTPAGSMVLQGKADLARLNAVNRWRGGVHIELRTDWRWSSRQKRLVQLG